MKKLIKRLIPIILAVGVFSFSALPVSAYNTVQFTIPFEFYNDSTLSNEVVETIYKNIYQNQSIINLGYTNNNSTVSIREANGTIYLYIQKTSVFVNVGSNCILNFSSDHEKYIYYSFLNNNTSISSLKNYNFTEYVISMYGTTAYNLPVYDAAKEKYYIAKIQPASNPQRWILSGGYSASNPDASRPLAFLYNYTPTYNPIIYPLYEAAYSLTIQKKEFVKWLIDNEKYVDIVDGLAENRVSAFVDIFEKYGGSSKAFGFNVKNYFQFLGIGQAISDYNAVLEKTRLLYQEYKNSIRQQLIDHYNNKVKDTLNIKPVTDDNNTTLITNTDSDDVIILILRDILRALIALPSSIGDLINALDVNIQGLENTVNVVNESGVPDFSTFWTYNENDFNEDLNSFSADVADAQQMPVTYLTNINNNALMPEKMLTDKDALTVNIPTVSGFTVSNNGKTFSTQTASYEISSNDYPWLDPIVKKIKRFSGILLILGYLVSLRYRLPEIVRGE